MVAYILEEVIYFLDKESCYVCPIHKGTKIDVTKLKWFFRLGHDKCPRKRLEADLKSKHYVKVDL